MSPTPPDFMNQAELSVEATLIVSDASPLWMLVSKRNTATHWLLRVC